MPTSPFSFVNNGRNREVASVTSSLKKQNRSVPLRRHSQGRVLHEGRPDRGKCRTWIDKRERIACKRPMRSPLQALQPGNTGLSCEYQTSDQSVPEYRLSQDFVHCPAGEEANADVAEQTSV